MSNKQKDNENAPWVQAQKSTFENWVNQCLKDTDASVKDIKVDLKDGLILYSLYQQLTGKTCKEIDKKPKIKISFLQNLNIVINCFKQDKVKIINVQGEDIFEQNLKLILGLLWMLIQRYHIIGTEEDSKKVAAKKLLLDFVNKLVKERKAKNFKGDWQDGVILSELINEIQPNSFPKDSRPNGAENLVKKALDVADSDLSVPKVIEPEYILDAVDELSLMTYVSYLKKKYEENELKPYGPHCIATGSGLKDSANGESPHEFSVELRNVYGNLCPIKPENASACKLSANIKGPQEVDPQKICTKEGHCDIKYGATTPGDYEIDVLVDGESSHAKNSPFRVKISRSPYVISGKGIQDGSFDKEEKLPIHVKSGTKEGGLFREKQLAVKVVDPQNNALPVEEKDLENGDYEGIYTPQKSGKYDVKVDLWGEEALHKSVALISEADKNLKVALSGEMFDRKVFPENRATGFVAKVSNGTGAPAPDADVAVDVKDASGANVGKVQVEKAGDGEFNVTVDDVDKVGSYEVEVKANGETKQKFGAVCEKGVQPELVSGTFTFEVQARDTEGNPKSRGGDRWEVDIKGPDDAEIAVETKDLGDGRYTATYHLAAKEGGPSTFKVSAKLDGKHVQSSPFRHELAPKPSVGQRLRNFFKKK